MPGATPSLPPNFLPGDPPPWLARAAATLLLVIVGAALVFVAAVPVPETIACPFVLLPIEGSDPVRAPETGLVVETKVVEGATVRRGAVLSVLRAPETTQRAGELETLQARRKGLQSAIEAEDALFESQKQLVEVEQRRLRERATHLQSTLDLRGKQIALLEEQVHRSEELLGRGAETQDALTTRRLDLSQALVGAEQLRTDLWDAKVGQRKLEHDRAVLSANHGETQRKLAEELAALEIRAGGLVRDLGELRDDARVVAAPCDGVILKAHAREPGAFVREGEVLFELACTGRKLEAALQLPETGSARVAPGLGVKLLYDSFPYQRFGVGIGWVRWVSPAPVSYEGRSSFQARVRLNAETMRDGQQLRPLHAGMTGTARVVVDRAPLVAQVFAPIRALRENLRDVPSGP